MHARKRSSRRPCSHTSASSLRSHLTSTSRRSTCISQNCMELQVRSPENSVFVQVCAAYPLFQDCLGDTCAAMFHVIKVDDAGAMNFGEVRLRLTDSPLHWLYNACSKALYSAPPRPSKKSITIKQDMTGSGASRYIELVRYMRYISRSCRASKNVVGPG